VTDFQAVQREMTEFLRKPNSCAGPAGVEQRRLDIYRELIYNNIESFLVTGFPVLHSLYASDDWHALVRDFLASHQCQSPYFSEISEEFLAYLQVERGVVEGDPPFLLELAHYEWVELALDIAPEVLSDIPVSVNADLLEQRPLLSPLAWPLVYRFPVHHIGAAFQPEAPAETPSYLVVYRNRDDDVQFMEINAITFRLLQLLQDEASQSGAAALEQVGREIRHPEPEALRQFGKGLLNELREASIILGAVPPP
jgi:hypothetical protein